MRRRAFAQSIWTSLLLAALTPACSGSDAADADASADGAIYRAYALPGGLDRIAIWRADPATDTCAVIRLVTPSAAASQAVSAPDGWGLDSAGVSQSNELCFGDASNLPTLTSATTTGQVTFTIEPGMYFPRTLSVAATLSFDNAPAWVPASISFAASDLPLE